MFFQSVDGRILSNESVLSGLEIGLENVTF